MASLSLGDRKQLGIYYTPPNTAHLLVNWAVRHPHDRVLEPSFGGCQFLVAAHSRLAALGAEEPLLQICGSDVDKGALDSLSAEFGLLDVRRRFLLQDFLATEPGDFSVSAFDAVVGNPPYISNHAATLPQRTRARELARISGWNLPHTASLWAYFVLHSLKFCSAGGRLAFVLPASFLLSNYAANVREELARRFECVSVVNVADRMFTPQGTDERCVLLLADSLLGSSRIGEIDVRYYDSVDAFRRDEVLSWRKGLQTLDRSEQIALMAVSHHAKTLGSIANIRIGTVTGANRFFLQTAKSAESSALSPRVLSPVLPKMAAAAGLAYTVSDHAKTLRDGGRCLMLTLPAHERPSKATQVYLDTFPNVDVATNRTFVKRELWFAVEDIKPGDALLSYMTHASPRLVLNVAGVLCTNNIHRIWWHPKTSRRTKQLVALSFLSSFTRLSAELVGRMYGGGVLKHELAEARAIQLLTPAAAEAQDVAAAFKRVDDLLRAGRRSCAESLADQYLLTYFFTHAERRVIIPLLSAALERTQKRRVGKLVQGES